MPTASSSARVPLKAMLAGACATVAVYGAMKAIHVFDLSIDQFFKSAWTRGLFAAGGFAAGRAALRDGPALRSGAVAFGGLLLGIGAGVVFWNGLEDYVLSRLSPAIYEERKLFPVDVILLWMFAWPPLLVGLAAGMFIPWGTNRSRR